MHIDHLLRKYGTQKWWYITRTTCVWAARLQNSQTPTTDAGKLIHSLTYGRMANVAVDCSHAITNARTHARKQAACSGGTDGTHLARKSRVPTHRMRSFSALRDASVEVAPYAVGSARQYRTGCECAAFSSPAPC